MTQLAYRRLGKSGLKVSSLSFGVYTFTIESGQSKLYYRGAYYYINLII
jgi:aryl-alcohol dehydrogenase-like predicted oxidoreductase